MLPLIIDSGAAGSIVSCQFLNEVGITSNSKFFDYGSDTAIEDIYDSSLPKLLINIKNDTTKSSNATR
jgi:hypothetical protein